MLNSISYEVIETFLPNAYDEYPFNFKTIIYQIELCH